MESKQFKTAE